MTVPTHFRLHLYAMPWRLLAVGPDDLTGLELHSHRNHGPTCVFWADLTPFLFQARVRYIQYIFSASRIQYGITVVLKTTYHLSFLTPGSMRAAMPAPPRQGMIHRPRRLGAVERHSHFPTKIGFVWRFCVGAQGA